MLLFYINAAEYAGIVYVQRVLAAAAGACFVVNSAEYRGRADFYLDIGGNIDRYSAENRLCVYHAVAVYDRSPQVALDSAEYGVELGALKLFSGKIKLCAGEYAASAAGHPALRITSAAPAAGADSAYDEPYADYYDHCGHEQLPQQRKIQYLLILQQRYHADAQEYYAACFVALGDESDKARDDEKQRPPAVKKYVYVRDAERVERKDDADRYEGYAPKDPACLFHIVSP